MSSPPPTATLPSAPLSAACLASLQSLLEPYAAYKSYIYSRLYSESLFVNSQTAELSYNFTIEAEREKMIKQQRLMLSYDFRPGCEKQGQSDAPPPSAPLSELEERWHMIEKSNCFNNLSMAPETAQSLHMLFSATVQNLGSARHANFFPSSPLIQSLYYYGCFCLTELSHGTNTKNMRTTATYDHASRSIVLHTPDKEAAKWWVGNLGKHATHGILAAQLIVDGIPRGLHWFIVQLRSLDTHLPLPGIIIGDVGQKMGWNATDHGFVLFQYARIPVEALLNRYQDIDAQGRYVLAPGIKNENARFAQTLSALSGGRVGIGFNAIMHSRLALIIAVRYSDSRRQFANPPPRAKKGEALAPAPAEDRENPVLDYQLQQHRLLLPLAYNLTFGLFGRWLWTTYIELLASGTKIEAEAATNPGAAAALRAEQSAKQTELHAISSGSKPLLTWLARDAITASRECMGGHGFSSFSRIGQLKREVEPSVTYEGENHVLIQQTAKYVADAYRKIQQGKGKTTRSPFGSLAFLEDAEVSLDSKLDESLLDNDGAALCSSPATLLRMLSWRVLYLLSTSGEVIFSKLTGEHKQDGFTAWNDSQVFYWQEVARGFIQLNMLRVALQAIEAKSGSADGTAAASGASDAKATMLHLWTASALGLIVQHIDTYLEGGYLTGSGSRALKGLLLSHLKQLRPHALSLVNTVSPPDWVVWSPLGLKANHGQAADQPTATATAAGVGSAVSGADQTYDNYFHAITHFQQTYERAPYWQLLRQPVPIVGQCGGRFGSTPTQILQIHKAAAATELTAAQHRANTVDTNTTGRAKL